MAAAASTEKQLKIKYIPAKEISPYENNSRTHSDAQIEELKKSIREFGIMTPIAIHNGEIVYGHARYRAFTEMGYKKIPTVDVSHLTEAQKRAYVIADNKLAMNAGWDLDILEAEIDALKALDFDVSVLGFTESELNFDWDSDLTLVERTEGNLDGIIATFRIEVEPHAADEIEEKLKELLLPYGEDAKIV